VGARVQATRAISPSSSLISPPIDIRAHEKAVHEALALLEGQSYLQRNGECFEFLTDVEKDIEVEIKNTEIEESAAGQTGFRHPLRRHSPRPKKSATKAMVRNYSYARRLDDGLMSRDADLAINIITTEHVNHDDLGVLAAQNTGKT